MKQIPGRLRRAALLSTLLFSALAAPAAFADWELAWSEEFDNGQLDPATWTIERMPDPHNQELQYYTDRAANSPGSNVRVENGMLVLEARQEAYEHRRYTSARIKTQGKREFVYGRFEARMRLPATTGMWPAFWLLGGNIGEVGWPACGEIDIMEGKGRLPDWTSGALNRGVDAGHVQTTFAEYRLPSGNFHDDWHVFSLDWEPGRIRWYVDGVLFQDLHRPENPAPGEWPYDDGLPYFVIFNLAVGGHFDAPHLPPEPLPTQQLLLDWLRVYRSTTPP